MTRPHDPRCHELADEAVDLVAAGVGVYRWQRGLLRVELADVLEVLAAEVLDLRDTERGGLRGAA